jgi:hypothetical protein
MTHTAESWTERRPVEDAGPCSADIRRTGTFVIQKTRVRMRGCFPDIEVVAEQSVAASGNVRGSFCRCPSPRHGSDTSQGIPLLNIMASSQLSR